MKNKFLLINFCFCLVTQIVFCQKQIKRDPDSRKDYVNVFYKPQYTLFDLWSDEPIFPDANNIYHIYYATNEDKTPKQIDGTPDEISEYTVYKFKNYNNCKNWCDGLVYKKSNNIASVKKSKPTKPKKVPTTRKCECCGIVFKIENGWMYRESLGKVNVYQFGEPDELAYEILTTNIATNMGYSEDEIGYHTQIKYHSKRCAYDCGN